jgi:predicted histidine transporter YuiF (NhaC family)
VDRPQPGIGALLMLLVGLLVTMGIGSSFSTVPILAAIFVPLCVQLGFSPLAIVCIVGTAGAWAMPVRRPRTRPWARPPA